MKEAGPVMYQHGSHTKELHIAGAFSPDYFTQKPFQMQQVGLTDLFYFIFYLHFLLFTEYGKLRPYVCFHNPSKQVPKGIWFDSPDLNSLELYTSNGLWTLEWAASMSSKVSALGHAFS